MAAALTMMKIWTAVRKALIQRPPKSQKRKKYCCWVSHSTVVQKALSPLI
jgi:hypothetical protein